MTILISHRGNVSGPNPENENKFDYLTAAIAVGYEVEVDVWLVDDEWYLGHDKPTYLITINEINQLAPYAWFHAKNYDALFELHRRGLHTFAHTQDPFTLTSYGWIWSHNGINNPKGIVVMPNLVTEKDLIRNSAGICHDYLNVVEDILTGTHPD